MLGKILGGRYQISCHLGGGGFGQTYLAEDLHLPGKPQCVVKQLKPRMTNSEALQTARRLFDTEAEVLYSLGNHSQIPRLFAHFEENRDFYLVQELIEGDVLNQEIKGRKQFSEDEVIDLLQDTLTVLEFVHQQQVVHRDIKPSNLIRRKGDRRIILIDFGAVKQIGIDAYESPEQASVTIAVGSSGYMPNEQLAGKPRFSSDVYAVGILAIQCLIGISPKKLKEDPKTSEIVWRDQAQVSPEFANILDKMVRYDFRQRYPSAKEALAALRLLTMTTPTASLLSEQKNISFDGHIAWFERGDELFHLQRYKEAISAYERVIQARPNEYLAWFKRGIALENLKRYEDAAESYNQVVRLQPEDYLAWYRQGGALENLQRHQEALQAYERVVELQPDNYWAWHDRGKVLEALQQWDDAISSYDRAVQIKSDFQLAVESRKRVLSQLSRVDTLYHLQHYDEAVTSCDRAIQENPNDPNPWLMRGMALENLNCHEQAIDAYDRVIEIQADDHVAWFKRGTLLEKLDRFEEAVASYSKVVRLQPDNYWAWNDLGRLLEQLQRHEEAISSYDRAVQIKPDFQAAVEGRRRMLSYTQAEIVPPPSDEEDETIISGGMSEQPTSEFKAQRLESVLETDAYSLQKPIGEVKKPEVHQEDVVSHPQHLERTIFTPKKEQDETTIGLSQIKNDARETAIVACPPTLHPIDYQRWLQKGRSLEKQRRYADALAAYDQASHIHAGDANLWHYRGTVLHAMGRYEAAIAAYKRTLELEPENTEVFCSLGGSLTRLKRFKEAIACFDQAIRLQPTNHTHWYWRGCVLYEMKEYFEAVHSFEQALGIKPDFQPAIKGHQKVKQQLKALELQNVGA